jgi:hypothetical protein
MRIYRNWIERKEEEGVRIYAEIKKKNQLPFSWGLDHLGIQQIPKDPRECLREYVQQNLENSTAYFFPEKIPFSAYRLAGKELSFPSTIQSFDKNNNTAYGHYFPSSNNENIIIVVPHWNASGENYDRVCHLMGKLNFASVRFVLPYHEKRDPDGNWDSTAMVSANIGLSLQSMRQAVQDIISIVNWLEHKGYKKIGIMGSSIGSCAAFLAACHDSRIKGFFANFMSSYFGDVVWTGESTKHIRQTLDSKVTQEELREFWLLNSPIAFVHKLKLQNPRLKQFIVAGLYDTTFRFTLTQKIFEAYEQNDIKFERAVLPCGHYSLGKYWFKFIDGYYIIRFFKTLFKTR